MKIEERFHKAEYKTCTEHDAPNDGEGGHHNPVYRKNSLHTLCYVTGAQCARKNRSVSEVAGSLHMASFLHVEARSNIFFFQKVVHFGPFSPKVGVPSSPNLLKE